jgi:hypothetical protein
MHGVLTAKPSGQAEGISVEIIGIDQMETINVTRFGYLDVG